MNLKKYSKRALLTMAITLNINTFAIASSGYVDVPKDHWAYNSISNISKKGYIVGNGAGEYKPNNPIDKFETAKILAVVSGYKYADITLDEKTFYDNAYNKHKKLIAEYSKKFTKWNSTADREISFLLEKGILIPSDLDQFVILGANKKEQLRALSRQEISVFLTKIMQDEYFALNGEYTNPFKDDKNINANAKPYVYFLRNKGVLSGDNNNNFNPNGAVTRAEFAVMLDKVLNIINKEGNKQDNIEDSKQDNTTTNEEVNIVNGIIDKTYPSINAIQVTTTNNDNKIYKLNSSVEIYVNDKLSSYTNITAGSNFTATLKDNQIVELRVISNNTTNIENNRREDESKEENKIDSSRNNLNENNSNNNISDEDYIITQGVVQSINIDNNGKKNISILVKILSPTGGVLNQTLKYTLDDFTNIHKGDNKIDFGEIVKDDVVKLKTYNSTVYDINILEKNRRIEGELVEKRKDESSANKSIVVKDSSNNEEQEFYITSDSTLERQGSGKVTFDDIKIGDSVEINTNYYNVDELYAYGNKRVIEGVIDEIYMTKDNSIFTIEEAGKPQSKYFASSNIDISNIAVGTKVRLSVDSKEILNILNIRNPDNLYLSGNIISIYSNRIEVKELGSNNIRTIYYDSNTNFIDSRAGKSTDVDKLQKDMLVYITLKVNNDLQAKTITILNN